MATGAQLEKTNLNQPLPQGVAAKLSALWTMGKIRWVALQPKQRTGLVVAAGLLGVLTAGLLWYALRTDWRTLYTGLEQDDARATAAALAQAQIPFETTPDGSGIRVPSQFLDKARLLAAGKGSAKSGRLGFELFDKPNWVGSEFDEKVNYQRALEGELEHTVATLTDVESARVHLVLPHDSLFRDQERPAKATIVLKLRHRALGDGEPEAIRNLVASSVDGLSPEHVVLVDAAGHLPLGPKTAEALRQTAEQNLEEKLIATLEPVTGSGNVRASVTVDYDQAATDVTQESYDPDKTVTLSMQRSEQTTGGQAVPAGVPGTATNAPNSTNLPVYPQQTTGPQAARSEAGTYGASKTERHIVEGPGKVRRLTAAIVVNDRLMSAATKNKAAVFQPRTPDEIRTLTALAQAAVGSDPNRGDLITVQDLTFDDNRLQQAVPLYKQILSQIEDFPVLVKYMALLIGLMCVLLFGLQPILGRFFAEPRSSKEKGVKGKKGAKGEVEGGEAGRELPAGAVARGEGSPALRTPEMMEIEKEKTRTQEIFDQVSAQLKREPSQSSRLLQSWIHSGE